MRRSWRSSTTTNLHEPGSVPWREVLTNRGVLALCLIMVFGAFYTYFFYSWFPKYLSAARGIENIEAGTIASIVLAGSAVGMLVGSWLADVISKRSAHPVDARRRLGVGCFLTAAGCMFMGARCDDPTALSAWWGTYFGVMHITLPNWRSVAVPQCCRHIGDVSGLMNGAGVIGAMASQWFVGAFTDARAKTGQAGRAQWDAMFDVYTVALVFEAAAWWGYRHRPLEADRPAA
jgi:MFS transporter, ACS family, glucarate transporter